LSDWKEYAEIEWDNFRDDLRDGRYHKNSLTIYDYSPEMLNEIGISEEKLDQKKIDVELIKKIKGYSMKVTRDGNKKWDYDGIRTPTNLNPAFDKRALHSNIFAVWKWPGRIYYYTWSVTDNIDSDILPVDHDAHISTRGLSMYIIFKVLGGTLWLKDAQRILTEIGKTTEGFDYGPRNYAQEWPKDPTSLDFSKVKVTED
jgi:hypothetical protein